VHACTDITGNGLAGHAWEVARASGVQIRLNWSEVPLLPGALEAAEAGCVPGGTASIRQHLGASLQLSDGLPALAGPLVLDPQTSGGLLLSVPAGDVDALRNRLQARGVLASTVGSVEDGAPRVVVDP